METGVIQYAPLRIRKNETRVIYFKKENLVATHIQSHAVVQKCPESSVCLRGGTHIQTAIRYGLARRRWPRRHHTSGDIHLPMVFLEWRDSVLQAAARLAMGTAHVGGTESPGIIERERHASTAIATRLDARR